MGIGVCDGGAWCFRGRRHDDMFSISIFILKIIIYVFLLNRVLILIELIFSFLFIFIL